MQCTLCIWSLLVKVLSINEPTVVVMMAMMVMMVMIMTMMTAAEYEHEHQNLFSVARERQTLLAEPSSAPQSTGMLDKEKIQHKQQKEHEAKVIAKAVTCSARRNSSKCSKSNRKDSNRSQGSARCKAKSSSNSNSNDSCRSISSSDSMATK